MYTLISPDNKIVRFDNIKNFIKEYDLTTKIYTLLKGKSSQYKGWRLYDKLLNSKDHLKLLLHNSNPRHKQRIIKKNSIYLSLLENLYPNISLIEQIYLFENNLKHPNNCIMCNNPVNFHSEKRGYFNTCSKRCANLLKIKSKSDIRKLSDILDNKDKLSDMLSIMNVKDLAELYNVSRSMIRRYIRKHKLAKEHPSMLEKLFSDWITTLPYKFIKDRKVLHRHEIDFYCKEKSLGIELNGLYFHGERNDKDQNYHIFKTDKCKENDIILIHIFEDEWYNKQKIIKNIILKKLGLLPLIDVSITFKCIEKTIANIFFNQYHIIGQDDISDIFIGIYHDNTLIAVASFYRINYQYTMNQYCTDGQQYNNILPQLLYYFIETYHPQSIITYSDRRYFTGRSLINTGFTQHIILPPSPTYTKDNKERYFLNQIFNISEYDRIWDCGQNGFILTV